MVNEIGLASAVQGTIQGELGRLVGTDVLWEDVDLAAGLGRSAPPSRIRRRRRL
jgi:hypothetical protein